MEYNKLTERRKNYSIFLRLPTVGLFGKYSIVIITGYELDLFALNKLKLLILGFHAHAYLAKVVDTR